MGMKQPVLSSSSHFSAVYLKHSVPHIVTCKRRPHTNLHSCLWLPRNCGAVPPSFASLDKNTVSGSPIHNNRVLPAGDRSSLEVTVLVVSTKKFLRDDCAFRIHEGQQPQRNNLQFSQEQVQEPLSNQPTARHTSTIQSKIGITESLPLPFPCASFLNFWT